jgi:hypothetical protein
MDLLCAFSHEPFNGAVQHGFIVIVYADAGGGISSHSDPVGAIHPFYLDTDGENGQVEESNCLKERYHKRASPGNGKAESFAVPPGLAACNHHNPIRRSHPDEGFQNPDKDNESHYSQPSKY